MHSDKEILLHLDNIDIIIKTWYSAEAYVNVTTFTFTVTVLEICQSQEVKLQGRELQKWFN